MLCPPVRGKPHRPDAYGLLQSNTKMNRIALAAALLLFVACEPKKREEKHPATRAAAKGEPMYDDVVPVGHGAAYALGMPSGIWYLRGSEAVPVRVVGDSTVRARFEGASMLLKFQPTGAGSAYAYGVLGGLWRLEGDSIVPVTLRSAFSPTNAQSAAIGDLPGALVQRERNKNEKQRQQR